MITSGIIVAYCVFRARNSSDMLSVINNLIESYCLEKKISYLEWEQIKLLQQNPLNPIIYKVLNIHNEIK